MKRPRGKENKENEIGHQNRHHSTSAIPFTTTTVAAGKNKDKARLNDTSNDLMRLLLLEGKSFPAPFPFRFSLFVLCLFVCLFSLRFFSFFFVLVSRPLINIKINPPQSQTKDPPDFDFLYQVLFVSFL
jgi:hypothetical protein